MTDVALETWLIPLLTVVSGIVTSLIASSGFWAHQTAKSTRNTAQQNLLMGLAHTRIMALCGKYIERGFITPEEYEDLVTYLYTPYLEMGGNGSVKRMMETEINKLPIKHIDTHAQILKEENNS